MADIFYRNITQNGDWVHVPGATSPYVIENANEDEFEVGVTVPVKTEFAGEVVVEPTAPEAEGDLPDIDVWLGEAMTPLDASEDFTGTSLTYALSPDSDPLPEGVTISSAGVISGTPVGDEDDEGVLSVVVRATDPLDRSAESVFDMTVRLSEALWTDEPTISQVAATTAPAIRAIGAFVSDAGQMVPEWPAHEAGDVGVLITTYRGNAEIDDDPSDQGWIHVAASYVGSGGAPYANIYVKRATSDDETDPTFSSTGATRAGAGIIVVSGAGLNSPWDIVGIDQKSASDDIEIPGGTLPHDLSLVLAICTLRQGSANVTLVDGDLENSTLTGTDVVVNYQHVNEPSIFVAAGTRETAGAIDPTTGELSSADHDHAYITLALRA